MDNRPFTTACPAATRVVSGDPYLALRLRSMQANGKLEPNADPDELATATIAAVQGGQLLSQTRRDSGQLAIVLDAAYAHLRAHAAWPGLARAVS